MKRILFLIALIIFASCSMLTLEPAEPLVCVVEDSGMPKTKAVVGEGEQLDEVAVLHYYQTNHRIMLIRHVELRDSLYVQTLTKEDMANLHITPAEQAFGEEYVVQLNELLKQAKEAF